MATAPQPFLASAPATRIARVSNTTLFHLAARFYGNALYWTVIAEANSLIDPWVFGQANILIPDFSPPAGAPSGIGTPVFNVVQLLATLPQQETGPAIQAEDGTFIISQSGLEVFAE